MGAINIGMNPEMITRIRRIVEDDQADLWEIETSENRTILLKEDCLDELGRALIATARGVLKAQRALKET